MVTEAKGLALTAGKNALCLLVIEVILSQIVEEFLHDFIVFHDLAYQLLQSDEKREEQKGRLFIPDEYVIPFVAYYYCTKNST